MRIRIGKIFSAHRALTKAAEDSHASLPDDFMMLRFRAAADMRRIRFIRTREVSAQCRKILFIDGAIMAQADSAKVWRMFAIVPRRRRPDIWTVSVGSAIDTVPETACTWTRKNRLAFDACFSVGRKPVQ